MQKAGSVFLRTEMRLRKWFRKDVLCRVEIWNEEDDKKLVVITNLENQTPLATTNYFKKIAKAIKKNHLKEIADSNVLWCESACWDAPHMHTIREIK